MKINPKTYIGKGSVERLGQIIKKIDVEVVIIDKELSPIQQRNLEKIWKCKVLDRTGLIIEIFGSRARTKEGVLQVELASLVYQRSRLVRSWTHLERQRGGVGFMGGPGETQIESDRRIISGRITKIKKELSSVRRTRSLHRRARKRYPFPIVALVGYTNSGKSTLFNALTKAGIAAENFPFCTIEPNSGIVSIPDERLGKLAFLVNPQKVIPTTVEFTDIAGLVAGASKGEGLGNQFLANIRETDAIAHVVRCFDDENVTHVSDQINPSADIETINTELALADLETVEKTLDRVTRVAKSGDKEAQNQVTLLEKVKRHLDEAKPVRTLELYKEEQENLYSLHLLTAKPVMYIANVDENGFTGNSHLQKVKDIALKENAEVVAICNKLEAEIAELEDDEKFEFLEDLGMKEAGLDRVIRAGYNLLGLQTYFTAGEKEVRAWTVTRGASAPAAAGVIHTDFEKGFIRAEVVAYEDFIQNNGEIGAKDAGKWRLEGKDYVVQDGDVIHFRFNV